MQTSLPPADTSVMDRQEFFRSVGTSVGAILLLGCVSGCKGGDTNEPDPNAGRKVDFVLNLSDPANENLTVKGGYVISSGVIVAQTKDARYVAVSANCTHQGSQVVFRSAESQFYCPLHQSRFDTAGKVVNGPATLPLAQYKVDVGNGTLRVYS